MGAFCPPGFDAIIESMDIRAGIITTIILVVLFALILFRIGIRSIQSGRSISYFKSRQQKINRGWRFLGTGIILFFLAGYLAVFGSTLGQRFELLFVPAPLPTTAVISIETPVAIDSVEALVSTATVARTSLATTIVANRTSTHTPLNSLTSTHQVNAFSTPQRTLTSTQTAAYTPSLTPTSTATKTLAPSLTPTFTSTSTSTHSPTNTQTPTTTFSPTYTFTPSNTPTRTNTPTPTRTPLWEKTTIFFPDLDKIAQANPPYEVGVTRYISTSEDPVIAILDQYFRGTGDTEKRQGLEPVYNGFTGFKKVEISQGIAHIYLRGNCLSNGTYYTIAQPIIKNLKQIPDIQYVKIYDQNGFTEDSLGRTDSVPSCLDPFYVPSSTPTNTTSPTATQTPTNTTNQIGRAHV